MDLNQKNSLAVVFPPHMNTANPNQKEWALAVSAALSEANLQHDFIDLEKINNYEIIVANGNAWSDEEVDKLLAFVKNGGIVIAYDNSFASLDENYQKKSRSQLSGLKASGTHTIGKGKFIFSTRIWAGNFGLIKNPPQKQNWRMQFNNSQKQTLPLKWYR